MLLFLKCYLLVLSISTVIGAPYETESSLRAGFGKADITGPIGAIPIQGYFLFSQLANGIHTRLYARACIMGDATNRVVYISADAWGISGFALENAIRIVSNPLYTIKNVMVSATHTHSTPSGTMETFLYSSNALGKVQGQREALQNGIAKAILLAHQNFEEHRAVTATVEVGQVLGASRNRSPQAYIANPESERAKYDADVDRSITTLTFRDETSGIARAVFSWFPVHGTSFSKKYHYVTGDNKGFASYIWEKEEAERGNTEFIAAFGQSNAGDVTPNTSDPTCLDSGLPCDSSSASCPDKYGIPQNGMCVAKGPGGDNENESAKIIGTASARAAQATSAGNGGRKLSGPVQFRHVFVDMSNVEIQFNGGKASTCTPVLGKASAAGTVDGPGLNHVFQGDNIPLPPDVLAGATLLQIIGTQTTDPVSPFVEKCQHPKGTLLNVGQFKNPYSWVPKVLPLQIFLIGRKLVILGIPTEITTMAGRRLKQALLTKMAGDDLIDADAEILLSGLANNYASYVTTYEEYQIQRYEGASTLYGPHTLQAFIEQFTKLADTFKPNVRPMISAVPMQQNQILELTINNDLINQYHWDEMVGLGTLVKPAPIFANFKDTVTSEFICSHPRGQPAGQTFMTVETKGTNGEWSVVMDDSAWDTKYLWQRRNSQSICELSWTVGETKTVPMGTYRFKIYGVAKSLFGNQAYEGVSNEFSVGIDPVGSTSSHIKSGVFL